MAVELPGFGRGGLSGKMGDLLVPAWQLLLPELAAPLLAELPAVLKPGGDEPAVASQDCGRAHAGDI